MGSEGTASPERPGPTGRQPSPGTGPSGTAGTIAGVGARYRCSACGNLTRFDVTLRRRTRAFHHYSLGGELVVEHEDVLAEEVEDVACRWCGTGRGVEQLGDGASR